MLSALNLFAPASASDSYAAVQQAQSIADGTTGNIPGTVKKLDGVTPYNLTGCQLLATVRDADGNVVISRQATITNALGGVFYFPFVIADTQGKAGAYTYDVCLTDAAGNFFQLVTVSAFSITGVRGVYGQAVTVPASQAPLALGPVGPAGVQVQDLGGVRTKIYVRTAGSDTIGDGKSIATAFRTLQHALGTIPIYGHNGGFDVDITGINDTLAAPVVIPCFTCPDETTTDATQVLFDRKGYVNIHADPVVLATLAPTATVAAEAVSGCSIITDTTKAWTVDQWKGKIVRANSESISGVVISNTATTLTVASDFLAFGLTFPVDICDVGATLNATGAYGQSVIARGVNAPIVFEGIAFPGNKPMFIDGCSEVYFVGCRVQCPRASGVEKLSFATCDVPGAAGVNTDSVIKVSQLSVSESWIHDILPQINAVSAAFEGCGFTNTYTFEGCSGQIQLVSCWVTRGAILADSPTLDLSLSNVRVDNAYVVSHVNDLGSAIKVFGGATVHFAESKIGGSGSVGYGLEIVGGGKGSLVATEPVTFTVTGTLGDLKVGNQPVRPWTDFATNHPIRAQVDFAHLSRLGENIADGEPVTVSLPDAYRLARAGQQVIQLSAANQGITVDVKGVTLTNLASSGLSVAAGHSSLAWGIVDSTKNDAQTLAAPQCYFGVNQFGEILGRTVGGLAQQFLFPGDIDTELYVNVSTIREGGDLALSAGEGSTGFRGGNVKLFGSKAAAGFAQGGGGIELDSAPDTNGNAAALTGTRYGANAAEPGTQGDIAIGCNWARQIVIGRVHSDLGTEVRGGAQGVSIQAGTAASPAPVQLYSGTFVVLNTQIGDGYNSVRLQAPGGALYLKENQTGYHVDINGFSGIHLAGPVNGDKIFISDTGIGFFGVTAVAKQTVPTTPTVADVVTALRNYGLLV